MPFVSQMLAFESAVLRLEKCIRNDCVLVCRLEAGLFETNVSVFRCSDRVLPLDDKADKTKTETSDRTLSTSAVAGKQTD